MNEELKAFLKAIGVDVDALPRGFEKEVDEESDLVKFAKDAISPSDLAVSGTISPTRAIKFIDLITKNSKLMDKITVIPMSSLKTDYDVWDMQKGVLVRVAEGSEPTSAKKKKIENAGRTLDAKAMQLFADVLRSTILNNQHRANLTSWLDSKFATKFANELVYLGFVGTDDTYANGNFNELNKGWIQVATDESDTKKGTYAADDTMVARLEKLVENADDDLGDDAKILIHRKDFQNYCIEVGKSTNSSALLIEAAAQGFAGYGFEVTNNMPSGTYILTPLKNLVFGMVSDIYRAREYNARKRAIEYTFDIHADYDIAVPKFVSLLTLASS